MNRLVAQVGNLLFRRLAVGKSSAVAEFQSTIRHSAAPLGAKERGVYAASAFKFSKPSSRFTACGTSSVEAA